MLRWLNLARVLGVVVAIWPVLTVAQPERSPTERAGDTILRRFDRNGDGKIDDEERRAIRELQRQRKNRPGAQTPSGQTVSVGDRRVTETEYASSDGRKIPCVISAPAGEGPFPVLVTIHGGQGDRDLEFLRSMAVPGKLSPTVDAFNRQPWLIVAISYRAGGGALFGKEHDDVLAGIRFAKSLPQADPQKVGVVGGSHGGHLALVAAEKMGREFLCVAAGSPWMTDPVVFLQGDPTRPPLSLVRDGARDELVRNGRRLFSNLQRGRGLTETQAREFLERNSIEAAAGQIQIPTLFLTSRGDDQAPHALIEPMIAGMRARGQEVQVYTAEQSPHGFYWARTVSAARALRGEKTAVELAEEETARQTLIEFFTRQFATAGSQPDAPRAGGTSGDAESATGRDARAVPEVQPEESGLNSGAAAGAGRARFGGGQKRRSGLERGVAAGQSARAPTAQQRDAVRRLRERTTNGPVPPGLERRTLQVGDAEREFFVNIPDALRGRPAPVVFALHGGASNSGLAMHLKTDFTQLGASAGFVTVYPSGVNGWNIGSHDMLSVKRRTSDADDVGFFRAMFDSLVKERIADPEQIFVVGGSNGGVMTMHLICQLADRLAGAGVVVATLPRAAQTSWPQPARPVPILVMLGTEDPLKPWEGNRDQMSASETVAFWRRVNGCAAEGTSRSLPDRDPTDGCRVTCERWSGRAPVAFYTLRGHGHGWPQQRGRNREETGASTRDISAPEEFWSFFQSLRG